MTDRHSTGLHDSLHEGSFKWFDGLKFKSHVCVPVHADGGNLENCVAWSIRKPKGCWDDRPCNEKRPFTCRIPVEGRVSSIYSSRVDQEGEGGGGLYSNFCSIYFFLFLFSLVTFVNLGVDVIGMK